MNPLVLYSTNTWLAYSIAQRYYKESHYVWCAPVFDATTFPRFATAIPPTSSPSEIYRNLSQEVNRGDRHSDKIKQNKIGIIRGASIRKTNGQITDEIEKDIVAIVNSAETRDFRPLLYVIPFRSVSKIVKEVPVAKRAHPLSQEYIIERLPRRYFDVIEFNL